MPPGTTQSSDNVINLRRRIAHLERREAALKASNAGYRRLLETLPDAVIVHSGGKVAFVNRAAQHLCGVESHQHLIGRLFRSLFVQPDDRAEPPTSVGMGGPEGKISLLQLRRIDGSTVEVEISSSHIVWNDKPARISILRDVTQRRRAIKAMHAAMRAKNEFLANMSHELRTPLNAIIGFSEIMQQELLGPLGDPRYNSYAAAVYDSGRRLLDLITRLLELSQLESGTMPYRTDSVAVDLCIRKAVMTATEGEDLADPHLKSEIATDLPQLMADERLLSKAISQMVRSVQDFTGPQSRLLLAASGTDDGGVTIAVSESERHPPSTDQLAAPEAWGEGFGLAGLGLSLTAGIVSLFGGMLSIDQPRDGGVSVTIRFPPERTAKPEAK